MTKRYRQYCGLARALDVLGERWTLLVVRELLLGPRRYTDLLASLPGVTTNLLAARLKRLEADGVAARDGAGHWTLTPSGEALEPAVMELARWGGRFLQGPRRGDRMDLAWGFLSMKRRYRGGVSLTAAVEVEGAWYTLGLEPARLTVRKTRPARAALSLHLTGDGARALFFAEAPPAPLLASGALAVDGAPELLEVLLGAFLPPAYASLPREAALTAPAAAPPAAAAPGRARAGRRGAAAPAPPRGR